MSKAEGQGAEAHQRGATNEARTNKDHGSSLIRPLASALESRGWTAVLLASHSKRPGKFGGGRLGKGEEWQTTRDPQRLEAHLQRGANIGLVTGPDVDLVVADVDEPELWALLVDRLGEPGKPWVETGSGKHHYYFRWEPKLPAKIRLEGRKVGELQRGGQTPGAKVLQQVVAPPSVHDETGEHYRWLVDPTSELLIPLPSQWGEFLRGDAKSAKKKQPSQTESRFERALAQPGASRRATGIKFQCPQCKAEGHDDHMDNAILFNDGGFGCAWAKDTELEDEHRAAIAKVLGARRRADAFSATTRKQRADDPDHILVNARLTDVGNAHRLVALHGDDFRYVHPWKLFLCWDGRRFAVDDTGLPYLLAKQTVQRLGETAWKLRKSQSDRRDSLVKHALRSERHANIKAMVDSAKSEPTIAVRPADLDSFQNFFNVRNGTLDLETLELIPHNRGHLLTKVAGCEYNPTATAPRFTKFISEILPDESAQAYVQRSLGSAVIGAVQDIQFNIWWGEGANGKSTLKEIMLHVFGDYATVIRASTLMAKKFDGIPNDVAALRGARLVFAAESKGDESFDSAKVLLLTGRDTVSARFMRAEWFQFRPEFNLFLLTNHVPQVDSQDTALWNRLRLIPFTTVFSEVEQDKDLEQKLRQEADGILNWLVAGYVDWRENGLGQPGRVRAATREWKDSQDSIKRFVEECCVLGADMWERATSLRSAYVEWCKGEGIEPSTDQWRRRLEMLGLVTKTKRVGNATFKAWFGVGLRVDDADQPQ